MRLKTFVVALVISCCLVGFARSAEAQAVGTTDWKRYELGKGNFSVLFPSQPKEEFQPSVANVPSSADLFIYSVQTEKGTFVAHYSLLNVSAEKWAESAKEPFYTGVWEGVFGTFDQEMEKQNLPFRTEFVGKREIKFSGYNGREVVFTLGPLRGILWTTLIGRQAFGAMVLGNEKMKVEDWQKFYNSYTITLKPITVEQTKPNQ